jgi:hypothetical protein
VPDIDMSAEKRTNVGRPAATALLEAFKPAMCTLCDMDVSRSIVNG